MTPVRVAEVSLPAEGFDAFTYPRYRSLLSAAEPPEKSAERIAVAAWFGAEPAGLALFSRPIREVERRLLSIMVTPLLRRLGIGSKMLALGEDCAVARGVKKLWASHSSQLSARAAFEALLRGAGWARPEEFEYRLAGEAGWSLLALKDWAPFLARLEAGGFRANDWNELTGPDREQVAALVQTAVPEGDRAFDPLDGEKRLTLVPELSLLLRRRGEIVGWILGSRGAMPDSIYYSHGYVLPSVQRAGWLVGGVREVCERQALLLGGETVSVFETASKNSAMRRFMERQLKPYSLWTDSRYLSVKELATAGPAESGSAEHPVRGSR